MYNQLAHLSPLMNKTPGVEQQSALTAGLRRAPVVQQTEAGR